MTRDRKNTKLQQAYQEKEENIIGELLFGNNIEETNETTHKLWKIREKKMKQQWLGQNRQNT